MRDQGLADRRLLRRRRSQREQRKTAPKWEQLLADIEAGKIDAVAAWDQDRVNRMMDDFAALQEAVRQARHSSRDVEQRRHRSEHTVRGADSDDQDRCL